MSLRFLQNAGRLLVGVFAFLLTSCKQEPSAPPQLPPTPTGPTTDVEAVPAPDPFSIFGGALGRIQSDTEDRRLSDTQAIIEGLLAQPEKALPAAGAYSNSTVFVRWLDQGGMWPKDVELPFNPSDHPWVFVLDLDVNTMGAGDPVLLAIPHARGETLAEVVKSASDSIVVARHKQAPAVETPDELFASLSEDQKKAPVLLPSHLPAD